MNNTAIINFGHPVLSDVKHKQRLKFFKNADHFYLFPSYFAHKKHNTIYAFDNLDIKSVKDRFENATMIDIFEMILLYQEYFPKSVEAIWDQKNSNVVQKLFSVQERLNELVFLQYFQEHFVYKSTQNNIFKYEKFIFISNSFFIIDPLYFSEYIENETNWYVKDDRGAKGIWGCDRSTLNYMAVHTSWDVDDYFVKIKEEKNDSEKYKYKLFERFNLKAIPNYGLIKVRVDMPENGEPNKIITGANEWMKTLY